MLTAISVVVPTYQSARTIAACLASIRAQRGVQVELVVVDNHSTDGTIEVARRFADHAVCGGPERSAQRNQGVRLSGSEWICWIDSDMVLPPDTLRAALDVANEVGARAVAIPERTVGLGYWTACRALERRCYLDDAGLHNPRLLRRELLDELAGFGELMSGPEDADLRLRLRARGEVIGFSVDQLIDHDEGHLTLREVWAKRVYYGRSLPEFSSHHPAAVPTQGRELSAAYWRNRRMLLADPIHLPGLALMRVMEAFGYLWGSARQRMSVRRAGYGH